MERTVASKWLREELAAQRGVESGTRTADRDRGSRLTDYAPEPTTHCRLADRNAGGRAHAIGRAAMGSRWPRRSRFSYGANVGYSDDAPVNGIFSQSRHVLQGNQPCIWVPQARAVLSPMSRL